MECSELLVLTFVAQKAYVEMDPAGRHVDEVQLWFVRQHHEPEAFTRYFQTWDSRLQMVSL